MAERLDDQAVVAREYATEERLVRRRLDVWADYRAPNPEDVALAALGEASPRRVLELGPGPGEFAVRVRDELGADVVAVDVSPRLVELVRARGIEAHIGDARKLPFTNSQDHMRELWSLLDRVGPLSFGAENGAALLGRHFPRVERRDVRGEVVFPTREALLGYLGAFVELAGDDLAARLPGVPIPFRARSSNAVFVADTAP